MLLIIIAIAWVHGKAHQPRNLVRREIAHSQRSQSFPALIVQRIVSSHFYQLKCSLNLVLGRWAVHGAGAFRVMGVRLCEAHRSHRIRSGNIKDLSSLFQQQIGQ